MPAWMINPMPLMSLLILWWALAPEPKPILSSWLQVLIAALVAVQLFFQWKKAREDRWSRREQHEMDMVHRAQLHEEQKQVTKEEIKVIEDQLAVNTRISAKAAMNGDPTKLEAIKKELQLYDSLRRVADVESGDPAQREPHAIAGQGGVLQPDRTAGSGRHGGVLP